MQDVYKAVEEVWPDLRDQAGLPPQGWRGKRLSKRDDARVRRAVMVYSGPNGEVVAKRALHPVDPDLFKSRLEAHLAAFEAMPQTARHQIPEVLAFDLERQSMLMRRAPGVPLVEALEGLDTAAQSTVLRRAGAWVSEFHACQLDERRQFQPKYTLRYLRQVMEEVIDGRRDVALPNKFLRWAELLIEKQGDFENEWTASCATHGDLHLRNLMVSDGVVTGLDFGNRTMSPVGHDIGRLLADYAIIAAAEEPPLGEVVHPDAMAAFFDGYTLVGADDPSVRLMLRMRLLSEWMAIPAEKEDRRPSQARRFRALKRLIPDALND